MISRELIQRGGSKLELTRAILEEGIDVPVPSSAWLYAGQALSSIRPAFERMRKPVILRGSHPNDYDGFVDVVPTTTGIQRFEQVEDAVRRAEERMRQDDVKIHCEDWGQPYSPEVHFLIQEEGSPVKGSMIRHPHDRTQMRIQWVDTSKSRMEQMRMWIHVLGYGGGLDDMSLVTSNMSKEEALEIIGVYETVEMSGLLDDGYSHQVEFGLDPLMFYQARPFKPFMETDEFRLPSLDCPHLSSFESFGLTPPDGVEIEFTIMSSDDLCREDPKHGSRGYGLILYGLYPMEDLTIPVGRRLGELAVYCSPCGGNGYLSHGNYKPMKKADVTLIATHLEGGGLASRSIADIMGPHYFENFRESRVFSNGRRAIIVPSKFM